MNTNLPTHRVSDSVPQTSLATSPGTRWTCCFLAIVLCGSVALADDGSDALSFRTLECSRQQPLITLRSVGELRPGSSWTFVIAHGLGGTILGDRFCQLANEIKRTNPDANVLLIDWSPTAAQTSYGIPCVWHIAGRINDVAADAASALSDLNIDPSRTTLIGESFGVYVQGKVATAVGGVRHILAFNPASELGGFQPIDLHQVADRTWSFHTYSVYDTTNQMAHADFFLETAKDACPLAQHTHGIQWLTHQLQAGDQSWLAMKKSVAAANADTFGGIARLNGEIDRVAVNRARLEPVPPAHATPAVLVANGR